LTRIRPGASANRPVPRTKPQLASTEVWAAEAFASCTHQRLQRRPKIDEALVKGVGRLREALVHQHLRPPGGPLNARDVSPNRDHRWPVRRGHAVPNAQVAAALRDDGVAARHPLRVLAKAQEGGALLGGHVKQEEAAALVAEQQVRAAGVELLQGLTDV
jgi:hypothetical protein